jgi:hypothetical protein
VAKQHAEEIQGEAARLMDTRAALTETNQTVSTTSLLHRAGDVATWQARLHQETEYLSSETSQLEQVRAELEHAVGGLARPEAVVVLCLRVRDSRQGSELVEDAVQAGLRAEAGEVRRIREEMVLLLDTVDSQLAKNAAVMKRCKGNVLGKGEALGLDLVSHSLQDHSAGLRGSPGLEQEDRTASTQLSWDQHSERDLASSTDARARSQELRGKVGALLLSGCQELMDAWGASNKNFSERINETERAQKNSLESLENTEHALTGMEHSIKLLRQAEAAKSAPRAVAESRLEVRSHRPGLEDCGDLAHGKLRQEVGEVADSLRLLRAKLAEAGEARGRLVTARAALLQDARLKETALSIDRGKCMGARWGHGQL